MMYIYLTFVPAFHEPVSICLPMTCSVQPLSSQSPTGWKQALGSKQAQHYSVFTIPLTFLVPTLVSYHPAVDPAVNLVSL